jgi:hypothetical protein
MKSQQLKDDIHKRLVDHNEDYERTKTSLELEHNMPVSFSFEDAIRNPMLVAAVLKAPAHVKPENVSFICVGAHSRAEIKDDYDLKVVFREAMKHDCCEHPDYNGTYWVNGKWVHSFSISYFKEDKEYAGDCYPNVKRMHFDGDVDKFCFDSVYARMQWAEDGLYQTLEVMYLHDMLDAVVVLQSVRRRNVKTDPRPGDVVFRLCKTRHVVEVEPPSYKTFDESAEGESGLLPGRVVYHHGDPSITKVCAYSTWRGWASRSDALVKARAPIVLLDEKARGSDYTVKKV